MTEVGTGGSVGTSNCATGPSTETAGETQYCTGQTGAIFTISSSGQISPVLSKLPSVIEENIQEVTGPSAIAYGHGQEALTIDDFLVNKDGTNHLLPKPFASAFGTLRLLSARRPGSSTSPLSGPLTRSRRLVSARSPARRHTILTARPGFLLPGWRPGGSPRCGEAAGTASSVSRRLASVAPAQGPGRRPGSRAAEQQSNDAQA